MIPLCPLSPRSRRISMYASHVTSLPCTRMNFAVPATSMSYGSNRWNRATTASPTRRSSLSAVAVGSHKSVLTRAIIRVVGAVGSTETPHAPLALTTRGYSGSSRRIPCVTNVDEVIVQRSSKTKDPVPASTPAVNAERPPGRTVAKSANT